MKYGITGNTQKDSLWKPVAGLVAWLLDQGLPFCLHENVATGLIQQGLVDETVCAGRTTTSLASAADVVLSFGGDGTMLKTAHEIGRQATPILGVNIGRLGFLAEIEVSQLHRTIEHLEWGDYRIESRMLLQAEVPGSISLNASWAMNEFVIERSGLAKLISIDVTVDGVQLNTYWADGLIFATPTGSTAYSLATGGPIMVPGCGTIILTPIAPHTLTVRPIVLPDTSVIEAHIGTRGQPYVLAADGFSTLIEEEDVPIRIRRADHEVKLIKLPEQHYFQTLRSKLMWGMRPPGRS